MDMQEIKIVLTRASQLNEKINDAIERAVQVDINVNMERLEPGTSSGVNSSASGVETRNLIPIRDALELLEEQLECLQVLQQQQQVEREAALTDLEESRRNLLGKLRNYQGREWELVCEALAFAGEAIDENHDIPPSHYPKLPSNDHSVGVLDGQSAIYSKSTDYARENSALEQIPWKEENDEQFISEVDESDSPTGEEAISNKNMQRDQKVSKEIIGFVRNSICRFLGSPVGKVVMVAAKAGFAAAGLVAALRLTEAGMNKQRKQGISGVPSPLEKSISSPLARKHQETVEEKCSLGNVLVFEDGMQKCVEETVPTVFYGRG